MTAATAAAAVTFAPDLRASDARANYWMRQVTIRLRREVCWCWHERGLQPGADSVLPPFSDRLLNTLDQTRFWAEKRRFYATDTTARYLTEQLTAGRDPAGADHPPQGSLDWVIQRLQLDDVSAFVLALALATSFDGSMGSVIAACLNDQNRIHPTLALAQKLWDEPADVLRVADPFHPLFRFGLVQHSGAAAHPDVETRWDATFTVPSPVAAVLLFPGSPLPHGLTPLVGGPTRLSDAARIVSLRLAEPNAAGLRVVPLIGAKGSARRALVHAIAAEHGTRGVELAGELPALDDRRYLNAIATVAWLNDLYLFVNEDAALAATAERRGRIPLPSTTIPATLFVAVADRSQLAHAPAGSLLPGIEVPAAAFATRVECWRIGLRGHADNLDAALAECARRFRLEPEVIAAICRELLLLPDGPAAADLAVACRAEISLDLGDLATPVSPRFADEQLILPHKQHTLFGEIVKAMRSLTEVHYVWGTGQAWNESGLSVLFAGPPGTGKTMAAEILATELGLPMYRIDLSQVVNKYIGETEKNLKKVFDAADVSDLILFFDEADALFGRRTEVSDAHDRYANLEISYLLERMERFKGLAILATNRKKDLDEAFLRRLRYVVDFPLPDADERRRIWRQVIPAHVDASQVEFDFLAEQFPLAGGSIRSIVLNACLQCADGSGLTRGGRVAPLSMQAIVIAIKREFDKMNRTLSLQQYGSYASMVEGLDHE